VAKNHLCIADLLKPFGAKLDAIGTMSAVWCLVSAVSCLVSGVWCLLSAVCYLLSTLCGLSSVFYLLSGVWRLVSAFCRLLSFVYFLQLCCLLSGICCLLSSICCQLSAVWPPFPVVCCLLYAHTMRSGRLVSDSHSQSWTTESNHTKMHTSPNTSMILAFGVKISSQIPTNTMPI
jgi:hypothetical protein